MPVNKKDMQGQRHPKMFSCVFGVELRGAVYVHGISAPSLQQVSLQSENSKPVVKLRHKHKLYITASLVKQPLTPLIGKTICKINMYLEVVMQHNSVWLPKEDLIIQHVILIFYTLQS